MTDDANEPTRGDAAANVRTWTKWAVQTLGYAVWGTYWLLKVLGKLP